MTISEKLPSRIEAIPAFVAELTQKLKTIPLKEEIFNVRLCLQEALVNAVRHGNRFDPRLSVAVRIEADQNHLVMEVLDQGGGFDFKKLADPTAQDNLAKASGRGVFLIKSLMDEVEYFDGGRGIRMKKFF